MTLETCIRRWIRTAFLIMVAASVSTLRADVIYSGSSDGPWQTGAASTRLAQTFSTGTAPMTLDSVGVWVRNANESNSSSAAGSLTLALFATDGANKPTGSSLLTIVNAQSIGQWGDGWVTGTSLNYSLAANSTYAVAFIGSGGSTISWKYNNSNAIASSISPTPTFYNWRSTDNGATWSDAAPTTGYNMVVNSTVVPEPATSLALGVAGTVAGLAHLHRRRVMMRRT